MLKQKQAGKTIRKDAARAPAPRGGNVMDLLEAQRGDGGEEAEGEGFYIQN